MTPKEIRLKQALNKAYRFIKPKRPEMEVFKRTSSPCWADWRKGIGGECQNLHSAKLPVSQHYSQAFGLKNDLFFEYNNHLFFFT
jgi:hypothetical protein